jgi:enoyl-CoA hydratase
VGLVSGHAIAGGCMLACACDRRIGLRGPYRMQLNEVAVGIPMPSWASLIAASAIPAPRLYDVLQLSTPLSFEEALALGTLHELAADAAELDAKGEAAVAALATLSAPAFAATKQRLWAAEVERVKGLQARE